MKWSEISQDTRFLNASPEEQKYIQEDWYNNNIVSNSQYKQEDDTQIRQDLFGEEQEAQPLPLPQLRAMPEGEKFDVEAEKKFWDRPEMRERAYSDFGERLIKAAYGKDEAEKMKQNQKKIRAFMGRALYAPMIMSGNIYYPLAFD